MPRQTRSFAGRGSLTHLRRREWTAPSVNASVAKPPGTPSAPHPDHGCQTPVPEVLELRSARKRGLAIGVNRCVAPDGPTDAVFERVCSSPNRTLIPKHTFAHGGRELADRPGGRALPVGRSPRIVLGASENLKVSIGDRLALEPSVGIELDIDEPAPTPR